MIKLFCYFVKRFCVTYGHSSLVTVKNHVTECVTYMSSFIQPNMYIQIANLLVYQYSAQYYNTRYKHLVVSASNRMVMLQKHLLISLSLHTRSITLAHTEKKTYQQLLILFLQTILYTFMVSVSPETKIYLRKAVLK